MKNYNLKMNICLNTWGNYNINGACGAEWLTLPMNPEKLREELERIAKKMGDNDPEWFVNDYDVDEFNHLEIGEGWNPYILNDMLEEINNYWTSDDIGALISYAELYNPDFQEAYEFIQSGNFEFYEGATLENMVDEWLEGYDLPPEISCLINYNWAINQFEYEGYNETGLGVLLVY